MRCSPATATVPSCLVQLRNSMQSGMSSMRRARGAGMVALAKSRGVRSPDGLHIQIRKSCRTRGIFRRGHCCRCERSVARSAFTRCRTQRSKPFHRNTEGLGSSAYSVGRSGSHRRLADCARPEPRAQLSAWWWSRTRRPGWRPAGSCSSSCPHGSSVRSQQSAAVQDSRGLSG